MRYETDYLEDDPLLGGVVQGASGNLMPVPRTPEPVPVEDPAGALSAPVSGNAGGPTLSRSFDRISSVDAPGGYSAEKYLESASPAEIERAQRQSRMQELVSNIGRVINAGMGSARLDPVFADMASQAGGPVRDALQRRQVALQDLERQRGEQGRQRAELAEAARRDPSSDVNRRLQQALSSRFGGIGPDVIGQVTVEDTETLGLLNALGAARERAESARAQREQELADMQFQRETGIERVDRQAQHRVDLETMQNEARQRRVNTLATGRAQSAAQSAPGEAALQRVMAAVSDRRAPDQADLAQLDVDQHEVFQRARSRGSQDQREEYQRQQQRNVEHRQNMTQAQSLSDDLNKSEVTQQISDIDRATELLGDMGDVELRIYLATGVMPGSPAAQALSRISNINLKNRSGAAVTQPEFERFRNEFGTRAFSTRADVQNGLRNLRSALVQHRAQIEAAYDPSVVDTFYSRARHRTAGTSGRVVTQRRAGGVRMRGPDGSVREDVPEAEVEHYRSLGAEVIE